MATLRISLLGGWHWVADDRVLPPPSPPKLKSLAACLLLHRSQVLSRDQLADWLWPDIDPDEARTNLRRHLHLLRQSLPAGEWILTERETVQWNPNADTWLDVAEFSTAVKNCAAQTSALFDEKSLALYQGDLLPELYDDWLTEPRETLRNQFLQTLEHAMDDFAARDNYPAALRLARQILAHDPLREEIHCTVMRLCALSGDRQAALQQFETCEALLRRELDVPPSPSTLELRRQILERELSSRLTIAPKQVSSAPRAEMPAPNPRWTHRRMFWPVLAALVVVTGLLAAGFWILRPHTPVSTFIISGPARVQDTWIAETFADDLYWPEDASRTPHEKYTRTHIQNYYDHAPDRILIRFDFSGLPEQARIETAIFEIHLDAWVELEASDALKQAMPAEISIFQILTPWQAEQATFNQPWILPGLQAGGDYIAAPLDTQPIDGSAWLQFDVTQAARAWRENPQMNQGLMMVMVAAPQDQAHYWVDMADQGTPALRPRLNITYR